MAIRVTRGAPRLLALLAAAGSLGTGAAQEQRVSIAAARFPLAFESEVIDLTVAGDTLEVHGAYMLVFSERVDRPIPLFYPFPRDSLMGEARMVSLRVRDGEHDLAATWEERARASGVRWWIPVCRSDSIVVEAVYRQGLTTDYARYIVTTTQAWGRPLRRASFRIRLPNDAEPTAFSFPFVPRDETPGRVYVYEATDFLPDRDIVVRWARPPVSGRRPAG